jgi:hypothetical protein
LDLAVANTWKVHNGYIIEFNYLTCAIYWRWNSLPTHNTYAIN